jgi:hypothetical protein
MDVWVRTLTHSRHKPAVHERWWRYLPLTRTQRKPLTCSFATPQPSPTLPVPPRLSAKRPQSRRERLDERDITELITVYREGLTATSLTAAHGLSLNSVKRLLPIAGDHRTSPTQQTAKATSTTRHP